MGGIDGYGIAGEPTREERGHRAGVSAGLKWAADICRASAQKARSETAKRALRKAAREIEQKRR
jgi:hypothetical protein